MLQGYIGSSCSLACVHTTMGRTLIEHGINDVTDDGHKQSKKEKRAIEEERARVSERARREA